MTIIAYIFLDKNRDKLIPLDQQRQAIDEYAQQLGLFCDEWLVEQSHSSSVALADREEGARLLAHMQENDTILVMQARWILSSVRSAVDLLDMLQAKSVSLYCLDLDGNISCKTERKLVVSQGIAPLVYQLCGILSQGETSNHGAAIRSAKARQKEAGKYMGGPVPFGWSVDAAGNMEEKAEEQQIIDEMMGLKAENCSYRDIAVRMREQYNLKFSHEGIRRILLKMKKIQV